MGASGDPLITCSRVVDNGLDDVTADAVCRVGDRKAMLVVHDARKTVEVANMR